MTTTPISLYLNPATLERLAERERETGQTPAQLAEQFVEEGLRMQRHPGIVFQDGPTGRRAKLLGGPDVWEVISALRPAAGEESPSLDEATTWLGLSHRTIQAAWRYYAEFPEEIDQRIAVNDRTARDGYVADRSARGLPVE